MRASLEQSLQDRRDGKTDHPAGSIVICNGCALPLFVLERAIDMGDKAGRAVSAFAPISPAILDALADARTVDAGLRAWASSLTTEQRRRHCEGIARPKSGDPMMCPFCLQSFAQVLTSELNDTLDRAYVIELVTVRPFGANPAIRGLQIGATKGWVH